MSNDYCSLHTHTAEGSIRDSIAKIKELVPRAKELGYSSLGVSNHG